MTNNVETAGAEEQGTVPLSQVVAARGVSIDFQIPALLCYYTLAAVSILTKAGLLDNVNRILTHQPHLVIPRDADRINWKLTNAKGEVINIESWEALQYARAIIMVTFDLQYENGEYRGLSWKSYGPEHISSLLSRGLPLSEKDFPKLPDNHCIVHVGFHRRHTTGVWICVRRGTYFVPDSLKLGILTNALVPNRHVKVRYLTKDIPDEPEDSIWSKPKFSNYQFYDLDIAVGKAGVESIKQLEFLIT